MHLCGALVAPIRVVMAAVEAPPGSQPTLTSVLRLLPDERLARAAARGNDNAFATLYARYRGALQGYCTSILLDAEDAGDAVQGAMLKALRALPRRDCDAPVRPWLYRIAHNEAIDILRRRRAHAPLEDGQGPAFPSADEEAAGRERLAELVADLRSLPPRQRSALVMRELSGLDYDEIALALGTSPAAARQTVFEARSALHACRSGRDTACAAVQRALSDGDRRRRRGRALRAHLRSCDDCMRFARAIPRRSDDLALLPPLFLPGAAGGLALVGGILGGAGAAGGGAVPVGALGSAVAGSPLAKGLAVAAVAVAIGGNVVEHGISPSAPAHRKPAAAHHRAARPTVPVASVAAVTTPRHATAPAAHRSQGGGSGPAASLRASVVPASRPIAGAGGPVAHVPAELLRRHARVPVAVPAPAPVVQKVAATVRPTLTAVQHTAQTLTDAARQAALAAMDQARREAAASYLAAQKSVQSAEQLAAQVMASTQQTVQQAVSRLSPQIQQSTQQQMQQLLGAFIRTR